MKTIFNTLLAIIFCLALGTESSFAAGQCPVKAGDKVSLLPPVEAYNLFAKHDLERDEFETTSEYHERLRKISDSPEFQKVLFVSRAFETGSEFSDEPFIIYNPDREMFKINVYAWSNSGFLTEKVSKLLYGQNEIASHDVLLESVETPFGSYKASNSYGASVDVIKVKVVTYGLYDRRIEHGRRSLFSVPTWKVKTTGKNKNTTTTKGYINITADRKMARRIKNKMRFGVAFYPRAPFAISGKVEGIPSIKNPEERHVTTNVLIGNILCGMITDGEGKILKIIETTY